MKKFTLAIISLIFETTVFCQDNSNLFYQKLHDFAEGKVLDKYVHINDSAAWGR